MCTTRQPWLSVALAAAVTLVGCEDPAKPLLTPSQIVGAWVLVLGAPTTCTSSGDGQQLHVDVQLSGQSESPTGTVGGGWDFDTREPPRYAINGTIDLRSGRLLASLWQQDNAIGSALDVVVQSYDSLRGQLSDPVAGASGNFDGGPCTFDLIGHR